MRPKSGWVATAVGTGSWILGLGKVFWPVNPKRALFFLTIASTIITPVVVDQRVWRSTTRD